MAVGKSSTFHAVERSPGRSSASKPGVLKWQPAAPSECPGNGRHTTAPASGDAEYGDGFRHRNIDKFEQASYAPYYIYYFRHMYVNPNNEGKYESNNAATPVTIGAAMLEPDLKS